MAGFAAPLKPGSPAGRHHRLLPTDPKMPDGKEAATPWHLMTYEFRLKPGGGMAPKPMAAEATEPA